MKVTFDNSIANKVYKVIASTVEFATTDETLMAEFGEPTVNIGGTLKDTDGTTVLATLPDTYKRIMSDFPVTMTFNGSQFANPDKVAKAWTTSVETQVQTAITTLRSKTDDFSGHQEYVL